VRSDARGIFDRLVDTPAVLSVAVSLLAGVATLVLVYRWRLGAARISAAVAVAAVVGGWALAQSPLLLPGLTVREAAAPDNVQLLLVISILAGGLILFPSLGLLFRLALRGTCSAAPTITPGTALADPTEGLAATITASGEDATGRAARGTGRSPLRRRRTQATALAGLRTLGPFPFQDEQHRLSPVVAPAAHPRGRYRPRARVPFHYSQVRDSR